MTISTLLKKAKMQKIGKTPVVVLPLNFWQEIESRLEDLEMMNSQFLRKKIMKARSEKKSYTPSQSKKMLGI